MSISFFFFMGFKSCTSYSCSEMMKIIIKNTQTHKEKCMKLTEQLHNFLTTSSELEVYISCTTLKARTTG